MTYDELVPLLKAVTTHRASAPRMPELAAWLRETLEPLPLHKTLTTRELMALGGLPKDAGITDSRRFIAALTYLRQSGLVEGCYRRDSHRKMAGNLLILWHRPVTPIEEGIF